MFLRQMLARPVPKQSVALLKRASVPTAEDVQVARIQQVICEIVPDAICELSLYGTTVICRSSGASVSFDRTGPSNADLVRHARQLKGKVDETEEAALRRTARDAK
jgi:hypothetical protein